VICVNEFEIHVNFSIRRVTRFYEKAYECGVQFHMMSAQSRIKIETLISQLQRDTGK